MLLSGAANLRDLSVNATICTAKGFSQLRHLGQVTRLSLAAVRGPCTEADLNAVLQGLSSVRHLTCSFEGAEAFAIYCA